MRFFLELCLSSAFFGDKVESCFFRGIRGHSRKKSDGRINLWMARQSTGNGGRVAYCITAVSISSSPSSSPSESSPPLYLCRSPALLIAILSMYSSPSRFHFIFLAPRLIYVTYPPGIFSLFSSSWLLALLNLTKGEVKKLLKYNLHLIKRYSFWSGLLL